MLAFFNLTSGEIIAIMVVALLLFGSRLPTIARSVGKSIVEFKKGVRDVQDELEEASSDKKKIEDKSTTVEKPAAEAKTKETANT